MENEQEPVLLRESPEEEPQPICSHIVFTVVTFVSVALITAVFFITAAYILVNLQTIQGQSGAGEAVIGIIGVVIVGLSLYFAVKSLLRRSRKPEGFDYTQGVSSGLGAVGWALPLMWILSIIYILIVTQLGADMGGGFINNIPKETLAAELMLAGPEEEIIFRALLIGIPMALIGSMKGQQHASKFLLGGYGQCRIGWIVVFVAAVLFALAHMGGWDFAKLPQVLILGIILGYLFMEFGLYACILAHSIFDVTSAVSYVLGDFAAEAIEIVFLGIGVVVLIFIVHRFIVQKPDFSSLPDMPVDWMTARDCWYRH